LDPPLEGIVGRREEVVDPRECEVESQQEESARLGEVVGERRGIDVGNGAAFLDGGGRSEELLLMQSKVDE